MAVSVIVLDLDGTLVDASGAAVPGVPEMLGALRQASVRMVVASNRPGSHRKLREAGLSGMVDEVLTRESVGMPKGSGAWVEAVCAKFGVQPNEIIWLGDDVLDMRSAVNSRIVYFNAAWSNPGYPYGISVRSPWSLSVIISECFMKPVQWYWQLASVDGVGRPVSCKAMIDGSGAAVPALKSDLIRFLKTGGNPRVGLFRVRDLMMLHLLGSIYGDGLYLRADTWTIYPGSKGGPNEAMAPFVERAAKLFRDRYRPDLLVRHTSSVDSGTARAQQRTVDFLNQINTVHLNEARRQAVEGKSILIIDDFQTEGYSSECARILLMEGGAAEVMCVSIGKYGYAGDQYVVTTPREYTWDTYTACTHAPTVFRAAKAVGSSDPSALAVIHDSYLRVSALRPGPESQL